jgi:transcriptional regulator with XRE-family HTH domain
MSQEALAARAGVSPRHLSFVENGKSNPSREVVLALAGALDVPLRDQNALLAAAGFASAFRASALDGDELASLRKAIDHMLVQQEPFGAVVVDGEGGILRMNNGALKLMQHFPPTTPEGMAAARNLILGTVHPGALAPYIVNWQAVAGHLVARLHREIAARPAHEGLPKLLARVLALPNVPTEWRVPEPGKKAAPFVTVHLKSATLEVRLFTMLTSIGTPLDVTAEELQVETYFPADDESEQRLRAL